MKYIYMNKTDAIATSDRHVIIATMKGAVSELNTIQQRAEAAEARAAALNATCNDLHETNMRLEAERDEATDKCYELLGRIEQLRCDFEKDALNFQARIDALDAERDAARLQLEQAEKLIAGNRP